VAASALLVSACSPTTSTTAGAGSPSIVATPASRSPSTALATASESPAPAGLAVDSLVEILVTDLVVRSRPGVDPPSTILEGRLTAPDRAFVVTGPVAANGYDWYLVAPLNRGDGSRGPFGWIARASREGEEWVRGIEAPCPTPVDLAGVISLQPLERLACFGDDTLTLTASVIGCGAGGGPWTFNPSWLVQVGGCGIATDASGERVLLYRVPPGSEGPAAAPASVTGHFDDPAAASCTVTSTDPLAFPAPSPEEAIILCRSEFVIGPGP
jgi:hypothetical protein